MLDLGLELNSLGLTTEEEASLDGQSKVCYCSDHLSCTAYVNIPCCYTVLLILHV